MSLDRRKFLSRVLDALEQEEARLLIWGVVDGFFEENEFVALVNDQIDSAIAAGYEEFLDARSVIGVMQDQGLVLSVDNGSSSVGYRSRMAETARLLLRLRQLFPKHDRKPTGWLNAPTLVADFRFQRRRRQYPRRDLLPANALARIKAVFDDADLLSAVRALLRLHDSNFRLAEFQLRSAERILYSLKTDQALATIVCAGTGSGKTLSFYLPALGSIARHLREPDAKPWVKAVALYPRTELLKDQFREVIGRVLELRKASTNVRVGALFGDTPLSAQYCDWPTVGADRVCPIIGCIQCNGELLWKQEDYSKGIERLRCADCSFELDQKVIVLTRRAMSETPPDILFTTTEMLNQRIADSNIRHLFGVGRRAHRPPELVLLDEVHTYEGRHGAQVAYLLRRWQHLLEQPLRFVGLSATLREPETFFSTLTGVRLGLVKEISPRIEETESEGAEYLMALRGDPVSRTALLSTTIQTAMLLGRCLDERNSPRSDGLFGRRTFLFTDDLDVTNRLYFDLLSAEGRASNGRPDFVRAPNGGLAVLRARRNSLARYRGGQDWRACEQIGHQLTTRLNVERVSSQDRGFDTDSDIVVATAALEVGFDDPYAGAVVQHKAPRGSASFLQRRGRAGRVRGMRPWTIVVLSDYGRDRTAYQAYDQLFDPQIAARSLPLSNRTIRRMQSVYALIDFLGQRLENSSPGSVWLDLAQPKPDSRRKHALLKELVDVLESEVGTGRLEQYLQRALRLSSDEVSALLWEFPRPLLTVVAPTAVRRLISDWSAGGRPKADFRVGNNPLPEFIPSTLFSELNLAEVSIDFAASAQANARNNEVMPVLAALREFAPGRVSRRFGTRSRSERYWVSPFAGQLPAAVNRLNIDSFGEHVVIGTFEWQRNDEVAPIRVFRPIRILPSAPQVNIADSSNARPMWHSQLVPIGSPMWLPIPPGSACESTIKRVGVYTHAKQAPVEVRRFTTGSSAEVGLGPGNRVRTNSEFEHEGETVGIGVSFTADAIVIELQVPTSLSGNSLTATPKGRALRTARFLDRAWRGETFPAVDNPFLREWLAQIYLSAITFEAVQSNVELSVAAMAIEQGTSSIKLLDVLATLFQSQVIESDGQTIELDGDDKLRQELHALLVQPAIAGELRSAASLLWDTPGDDWAGWIRGVYESTLAAGVLRAIGDLCPTIDPDDFVVDLGRGPVAGGTTSSPIDAGMREIWISEKSPGGNGQVEEFLRSYAEDPRRFFAMVRAALDVSEFELVDRQLIRLTRTISSPDTEAPVRECVRRFRSSESHAAMARSSQELRLALVRDGFSVFHGFLTALGTRVLRPGTGSASDAFVDQALRRWTAEEARLGIEIDLRIMAYCLSRSAEIDEVAQEAGVPAFQDLSAWRMSAIYGLLWPRGRHVRNVSLQLRNPFAELPLIERLLVFESLQDERIRVAVANDSWFAEAAEHLSAGRLVTLVCEAAHSDGLADAIAFLITNPVDSGYLKTYARLQRFRRVNDDLEADVELAEAAQ